MNLNPKELIIETSDVCNLRCKFCPTLTGTPSGFMDLEVFKSLVDRIDFPCTLLPWFLGEATLHPEIQEIFKYLNFKNQKYYLTTNGMQWTPAFEEMLSPFSSAYQIIFSLDGLCEDTALKARPGTDFFEVLDNIHRFLRRKKEAHSSIDVGIKLCHRGQDWGEVEEFIQRWLQEEGINYVAVGRALTEINEESMRQYYCKYIDNFMIIRMNGDLVPCCYHGGAVNDHLLPLGNVLEDSLPLSHYFNSKEYIQLREAHETAKYPSPCDKCGFAYTGSGFRGEITFRSGGFRCHFHQDFYNSFFSLTPPSKPDSEYTRRF